MKNALVILAVVAVIGVLGLVHVNSFTGLQMDELPVDNSPTIFHYHIHTHYYHGANNEVTGRYSSVEMQGVVNSQITDAFPTSVNSQVTDFARNADEVHVHYHEHHHYNAIPTPVNGQITDAFPTSVNSQVTDIVKNAKKVYVHQHVHTHHH